MSHSALIEPPQRPQFHFSPPAGWLNDPNGLIYADGEYHLFYQHHPHSLVWGPMHWGHAVSRDLVHWEDLPIALAPDELGQIFSGSVVVDHQNSAGFGSGAMVAVFTHAQPERQVQSLAYSLDRGRSWAKYAGNPVLVPPGPLPDFRDPRVLWYEDTDGGHWVMLLAVGGEVWFYTSPNLQDWTLVSAFGRAYGAHSGVWECPELMRLPVEGSTAHRWVLSVGVLAGGPAGGSGTQYFVGSFDGTAFHCDDPPDQVRWADYGADFYAAQAWQTAPGGRTIWLAWMNNWTYARETPASTWRGMMTVPRELCLAQRDDRFVLVQRPARELVAARSGLHRWEDRLVHAGETRLDSLRGERLELQAIFRLEGSAARAFGLRLHGGTDEAATIRYDVAGQQLTLVRHGPASEQLTGFAERQTAPVRPQADMIFLHILVDSASLEIFAEDGQVVLTSQIFPPPGNCTIDLFVDEGPVRVQELRLWHLG